MKTMVSADKNVLRFLMTEDLYVLRNEDTQASVLQKPAHEELLPPTPDTEPGQAQTDTQTGSPAAEASLTFDYAGENNRYMLMAIADDSHPLLNETYKDILVKILGAKQMDLRDVAVINLDKYPQADFPALKKFFSCSKLVLFGIDPNKLGLPSIAVNMPEKHDGVTVLTTFSLDEMNSDTYKKRQYWTVMKDF